MRKAAACAAALQNEKRPAFAGKAGLRFGSDTRLMPRSGERSYFARKVAWRVGLAATVAAAAVVAGALQPQPLLTEQPPQPPTLTPPPQPVLHGTLMTCGTITHF